MENKLTLQQKLMKIQRAVKTFDTTADSDKKIPGSNKSAYRYTPSWVIMEKVRELMDEMGIMLEQTLVDERDKVIEQTIYKMQGNQIKQFEKKEIYVTLRIAFTWVDTETGEERGPFIMPAAGANGTDKSMASALALAERYFLLKYFRITTRDLDEEPDAHDSENVPGIPDTMASPGSTLPVPTAFPPSRQPSPAATLPGFATQQGPVQTHAPQARTKEQLYDDAARELSCFDAGTPSHGNVLTVWMTKLNLAGYDTTTPNFAANLVEFGQALREGRQPVYRQ